MDALHFDRYASYSDSSAPRTPSPNQPTLMSIAFPLKHGLLDEPVRNIFADNQHDDNAVLVHPEHPYGWAQSPSAPPFQFVHSNNSRGSLLHELYNDHDSQEHHLTPEFPSSEPQFVSNSWQHHKSDPSMMRRATFPYVRQDREEALPLHVHNQFFSIQQQHQLHSFSSRPEALYPDTIPTDQYSSPHAAFQHFDDGANIKLEDSGSIMMPQHFYRQPPPPSSSCHPMAMSYLSPHTGLPVQHTDDAASKETQYLRRRCTNCHTTEPPSWRRSTLNPGKIVCNKCGLYERTHLRPRPLRFDELRAGGKARKQHKRTLGPKSRVETAAAAGNGGAPTSPILIKKEPREFGLVRRSSVSSISSGRSGSGASDWDDSVSLYSSGSAPPTSYNSPAISPYPLSRADSSSPNGGGVTAIRLPNAPLSDIASIGANASPQLLSSSPAGLSSAPNPPSHTPHFPHSPRRSQTSPDSYFPPPPGEDYFLMRKRAESVNTQHDGSLQLVQMPGEQPNGQLHPNLAPSPVAS